jgi:hypothetical protein
MDLRRARELIELEVSDFTEYSNALRVQCGVNQVRPFSKRVFLFIERHPQ